MSILFKLKWVYLYLILIPIVNYAFTVVPMWVLPDGGLLSPFSLVVGLILVLRDLAQREIGHWIFIPLIIGTTLSFEMAGPAIALASGLSFFVSETVDWAVYTFTKRPLSERIMLSSLLAVPVDTSVFLYFASMTVPGIFSTWTVIGMVLSKLIGSYVVFRILKHKENKNL